MTIADSLREINAHGYLIELGNPKRIRLAKEEILLKTHEAASNVLNQTSKYPAYFATLDVLRAAFASLPEGSWAIYSHPSCQRSHVIWKDFEKINTRPFEKESELNGLRAWALQDSCRVQIVQEAIDA